ncbi:Nitroreductase-like protein [Podospora didyma]|uniref:Nitroreductase-like protein n=1 Tax=Podospora didyma TaxID=330526 RepID=A0AAE0K5R2_9PEZI|nr:Nitroreductase-like protein [Podospora didyma]
MYMYQGHIHCSHRLLHLTFTRPLAFSSTHPSELLVLPISMQRLAYSPAIRALSSSSSLRTASSLQRFVAAAPLQATTTRLLPSRRPSSRSFTTTPTIMSSTVAGGANALLDLIKNRRSHYALNKDLTISPERVQEIVKEALQHVPSSFNSQSNRVVVLFGAEHDKFWDITTEVLKGMVPEDKWEATAGRMAMFKGGAGTILFFEDVTVVEGMQAKFALYADRFPVWATQSTGMLQHTLWVALEAEGLGANLQHYNPIVDAKVADEWKLPATWKLNAQLVFGGKSAEAGEKAFGPIEEKLKVFGA